MTINASSDDLDEDVRADLQAAPEARRTRAGAAGAGARRCGGQRRVGHAGEDSTAMEKMKAAAGGG